MNINQGKLATLLRADRQYEIEHRALRNSFMADDQSARTQKGREDATARAKRAFDQALDALNTDELVAYGEYRSTH